jgi:hypothetical protein
MCDGLGVRGFPWVKDSGIDHVLQASQGYWHHTVCGTFGNLGPKHHEPKRRCRKCVERIKSARPWADGPNGCPVSQKRKSNAPAPDGERDVEKTEISSDRS